MYKYDEYKNIDVPDFMKNKEKQIIAREEHEEKIKSIYKRWFYGNTYNYCDFRYDDIYSSN